MALRATFRLLMSYGLRAPLVPLSLRGARNFILTTLPLVMVSLLFATAVLRSDCKSTSATFTKRPPRPSQMFKSGEWCLTAKQNFAETVALETYYADNLFGKRALCKQNLSQSVELHWPQFHKHDNRATANIGLLQNHLETSRHGVWQ